MKLATWNLEKPVSQRRREAIRAHTDRERADIWVLTETHDGFTPGHAFSHSSAPGCDGDGEPEHRWVTIWSRHLIEPLTTSDLERQPPGSPRTRAIPFSFTAPCSPGSAARGTTTQAPAASHSAQPSPSSSTTGCVSGATTVRRALRARRSESGSRETALLRVQRKSKRARSGAGASRPDGAHGGRVRSHSPRLQPTRLHRSHLRATRFALAPGPRCPLARSARSRSVALRSLRRLHRSHLRGLDEPRLRHVS